MPTPEETIQAIRDKCEEIKAQRTFIFTLAGKTQDPKWVGSDPGYTNALAVYASAKAALITLVGELP